VTGSAYDSIGGDDASSVWEQQAVPREVEREQARVDGPQPAWADVETYEDPEPVAVGSPAGRKLRTVLFLSTLASIFFGTAYATGDGGIPVWWSVAGMSAGGFGLLVSAVAYGVSLGMRHAFELDGRQ